jgi:hypothetical protein
MPCRDARVAAQRFGLWEEVQKEAAPPSRRRVGLLAAPALLPNQASTLVLCVLAGNIEGDNEFGYYANAQGRCTEVGGGVGWGWGVGAGEPPSSAKLLLFVSFCG